MSKIEKARDVTLHYAFGASGACFLFKAILPIPWIEVSALTAVTMKMCQEITSIYEYNSLAGMTTFFGVVIGAASGAKLATGVLDAIPGIGAGANAIATFTLHTVTGIILIAICELLDQGCITENDLKKSNVATISKMLGTVTLLVGTFVRGDNLQDSINSVKNAFLDEGEGGENFASDITPEIVAMEGTPNSINSDLVSDSSIVDSFQEVGIGDIDIQDTNAVADLSYSEHIMPQGTPMFEHKDNVSFGGFTHVESIADQQTGPTCSYETIENLLQLAVPGLPNNYSESLAEWIKQKSLDPSYWHGILQNVEIPSQWYNFDHNTLISALNKNLGVAVIGNPHYLDPTLYPNIDDPLHAFTLTDVWKTPNGSILGYKGIDSNCPGREMHWTLDQVQQASEHGGGWARKVFVTLVPLAWPFKTT